MNDHKVQGEKPRSTVRRRPVKLHGVKTNVSLEDPFWQALAEIALARGITRSTLIGSIAEKGVQSNLSSAVRVYVLDHFLAARRREAKP